MKYIATMSFGKDSTVMCDLLLKNNYPLDYIVFANTMLEFPMMYEYKEKVCKYFKERYGVEVVTTTPETTFEDWCFGTMDSGDMKGYVRGIPMVWAEPCYWRREAKVKPLEKFEEKITNGLLQNYDAYLRNKSDGVITKYIGFTLDENRNVNDTDIITHKYPLRDVFMMTERNCQEYLINQEMENPLYKFFSRTGCSVCPAQSDKAWFEVWKNFPETWGYMKDIERELQELENKGHKIKNKTWFNDFRTCEDMEAKFIKADRQGSLFDFSDEPLKDCFCKI